MIKQIIISVIIAILFFSLGFGLGDKASSVTQPTGTGVAVEDSFQSGWNAAKERLEETGFMPPTAEEIKTVYGVVQEISGQEFKIKINPLEPLAEPDLDLRIVKIDDNTKVYQLKQKSMETIIKEEQEFEKKMQEQFDSEFEGEFLTPPEQYTKEKVDFANIKPDQRINVTAEQNIKDLKEFRAEEILIQDTFEP